MSKIKEPIEIFPGIYHLPGEMDNMHGSPYSHRVFKKMDIPKFTLIWPDTNDEISFESIYYNDYDKVDLLDDQAKILIEKNINALIGKRNNNFIDSETGETIDKRLLAFGKTDRVIGFSVGGGLVQNRNVFFVNTDDSRSTFYLCVNLYSK